MDSPQFKFPVLHQIYVFSLGYVRGNIFWRTAGHGQELGADTPMLMLVAQRPAVPRGRPRKDGTARQDATHCAYALDAAGRWWHVRIAADGTARARTIAKAPYSYLGRRRVGWTPTLKTKAREALEAAQLDFQRQRCPLL